MKRKQLSASAVVAALTLAAPALAAIPARAAEPVTETFAYTGAEQTFAVPDGVTALDIVLIGGKGGGGAEGLSVGGFAGRVEGRFAVEPGSTLYVEVGGNGGTGNPYPGGLGGAGGFNGGGAGGTGNDALGTTARGAGGGGGASDIRTSPRSDPNSLDSRLMVAAGGGGGGSGSNGGTAGAAGSDVVVNSTLITSGGDPGSGTNGGGGGTGDISGAAGSQGSGAAGLFARGPGGGGGGGLFGGGSGGGANVISWGAGGGGGSNSTGTAFSTSVSADSTGVPSIVVSYAPDTGSGIVAAQVTTPSSAACLELSTPSIDFGTLPLGSTDERGTPDINVTNCSGADATFLARGSDASGGGATWSLVGDGDTCAASLGFDNYHLTLKEGVSGSTALWRLGTNNQVLLDVPGGSYAPFWPTIDTACPGSVGSGTTMSMQIIFVATEAQ